MLPEIEAAGASLVALSPQREPYLREVAKRHKLTFEVLRDKESRVAGEFGLTFTFPDDLRRVYLQLGIDLERFNGDASWTLPMPARFIIDEDSMVRYAAVDPDYTVRPEPSETVKALETLSGS